MSKSAFFTDPHVGIDRIAHTTVRSRALLREHIYNLTLGTILSLKENYPGVELFCTGDLLDRFSNDETTILQANEIAKHCKIVLGGNHDQTNRTDRIGTLELLHKLHAHQGIVQAEKRDEPYMQMYQDTEARTVYFMVPHAMTQKLFHESLVQVSLNAARQMLDGYYKILLLHCNVGVPHEGKAVTDEMTALWLTPDMQKELIETTGIDLVLIGHEHTPESLYDGKIRILGNVYPLGFGEIADRFAYVYDSVERSLTPIMIASMADEYLSLSADEIIGSDGKLEVSQRMIEIEGRIKPQDMPALSRAIANFWKTNPHLFSVRPRIETESGAKATREKETFVPRTLRDAVNESVKTTPFSNEYDQIISEMDEEGASDA